MKYELGLYTPEDDILHSDRREHLISYNLLLRLRPLSRSTQTPMPQSFAWSPRKVTVQGLQLQDVRGFRSGQPPTHPSPLAPALSIYRKRLHARRMASSGMLRRVALVRSKVAEEIIAAFIRVTIIV
jgi:hypothetical protein